MPLELRWLASASTSCFHAVERLALRQSLADLRLADALSARTRELQGDFGAFHVLDPVRFDLRAVNALRGNGGSK